MTAEEFRAHLTRALEDLGVADAVAIQWVAAESAEGAPPTRWTADVRVTAQPDVSIGIAVPHGLDEPSQARELRAELRRALRMCPLCQHIGHVEKLRDAQGQQQACAVRCPACGEFEIDQALIRELRSAWERDDRTVLDRLPAVSGATRRGPGAAPRLTTDNWRKIE